MTRLLAENNLSPPTSCRWLSASWLQWSSHKADNHRDKPDGDNLSKWRFDIVSKEPQRGDLYQLAPVRVVSENEDLKGRSKSMGRPFRALEVSDHESWGFRPRLVLVAALRLKNLCDVALLR